MSRLHAQLQRLYPPGESGVQAQVRSMVLELSRPASWSDLGKVWQGVQADLGLPAPGIAVSGDDGLQLWFSLAQPVTGAQATDFLQALRDRYLPGIEPRRLSTLPGRIAPPREVAPGHWSAFITSDLAALFEDEPFLDLPPGDDAQADLLSRLQPAAMDDWQRALQRLGPAPAAPSTTASAAPPAPADHAMATAPPIATDLDPRRFLLDVLNDPAMDMRWRIEAAKALLPGSGLPHRT